jgi:hypothetical protein
MARMNTETRGGEVNDNGDKLQSTPKISRFFGDPAGNRTRSDRSTDREIRMFLPRFLDFYILNNLNNIISFNNYCARQHALA